MPVSAVNRPSTAFGLEAERDELELERRHVPADCSEAELTLAEERSTERTERHARCRREEAARREAGLLLEGRQAGAGERPVDPVDSGGVVAFRLERHLEGGDGGAPRGCSRPRESESGGNGGRNCEQAVHASCVGRAVPGL